MKKKERKKLSCNVACFKTNRKVYWRKKISSKFTEIKVIVTFALVIFIRFLEVIFFKKQAQHFVQKPVARFVF